MESKESKYKPQTIIVLAGDYRQFQLWRHSEFRPATTLVYADSLDKIRGVQADEVVVTGTFWDLPNAGELFDLAHERRKS